jgi:cell wall-associated NlpC family hydrolase
MEAAQRVDGQPAKRRRRQIGAAGLIAGVLMIIVGCSVPPEDRVGWSAVVYASQQDGKPYAWGGAGPAAFDCSGLTSYAYARAGRMLPRTAQEQYNVTEHVPQSAAKPGDLIFSGAPYGVYHVAMYAGNGMIWDAPGSGRTVLFRPIWDPYFTVGRVH